MGKYNSSTYRVNPLMKYIQNDLERLNKFLSLLDIRIGSLPKEYFYGDNEKLLKPTKKHLLSLLNYLTNKTEIHFKVTNEDRELLFGADKATRERKKEEAIELINQNYEVLSPKKRAPWYIFEGFTHPDIFIEGNDYVLLGEGKWTENHITTNTSNLIRKDGEYRNQMTRHIQAALNYTDKKVYAFYIVDDGCGYLEDLTKEGFRKQLDKETIAIPNEEKAKINNSFIGYTTWQKIQNLFPVIEFLNKKQIDELG